MIHTPSHLQLNTTLSTSTLRPPHSSLIRRQRLIRHSPRLLIRIVLDIFPLAILVAVAPLLITTAAYLCRHTATANTPLHIPDACILVLFLLLLLGVVAGLLLLRPPLLPALRRL